MLFFLLAIPLIIGLLGLVFGKGLINWKEFLVQEIAIIVIIGAGYAIAIWNSSVDTEIWNGVISQKYTTRTGCCHSYRCHCHNVCTGSGKNQTCSEECDTCYEHSHDNAYYAITSNDEEAYSKTCVSPSSYPPNRWERITLQEPTAIEHMYENYVKGNPDTIIKRTGIAEKFKDSIPDYPQVYDYYRVNHLIVKGFNFPQFNELNSKLFDINASLGAKKKVNMLLILTNQKDQNYLEAIREAWIGGKKNDIIIVVGMATYPTIDWAGVISWTKNEEVKINIRDKLLELHTFDTNKVLDILRVEVQDRFEHRHWSDFQYLQSTIQPSSTVLWILFILGTIISIGLTIFFYTQDPFDAGDKLFKRRNKYKFLRRKF